MYLERETILQLVFEEKLNIYRRKQNEGFGPH